MKSIKFNWATVLAAAAFWSYGFYGGVSSSGDLSSGMQIAVTVLVTGVFAFFLWLSLFRQPDDLNDQFQFSGRDLKVALSYLVVAVGLSWEATHHSLTSDELYHSQRSQLHALTLLAKLSQHTHFFDGFRFSTALYLISLANLIAISILGFLLWRLRKQKLLVQSFLVFLFLGCRIAVLKAGGYTDPHPPLRLFPLWLTTSLLPVSDFSFRMPQILAWVVTVWFLWKKATSAGLKPWLAWLLGFAGGSIPVFFHTATLAEQSIWTTLTWTILLLSMADEKPNWGRLFSIVALATLMRQSAVVGFAPLIFLVAFRAPGRLPSVLFPAFLMIPFFARSLVLGTPSTVALNHDPALTPFARLALAFSTAAPWRVFVKDLTVIWLPFLAAALLPLRQKKQVLLLFGLALFMFFSIDPALWGIGRYQAEYIVPFLLLGLLAFATKAISKKNQPLLILILVILTGLNLNRYLNLNALNRPDQASKPMPQWTVLSELTYDYGPALTSLRDKGLAGSAYVEQLFYGTFAQVLAGYSVSEVMSAQKLASSLCQTSKTWFLTCKDAPDAKRLNAEPALKAFVSPEPNPLVRDLLAYGWKKESTFSDNRSGWVVSIVYRRK